MPKAYSPVPFDHLNPKEREVVIAAGMVRTGEMTKANFQTIYRIRVEDAEDRYIRLALERRNVAYDATNPTDGENLTDAGNSRRFARQHGAKIRFSHERGQWLVWDEKR